jgi:hypothetical protein
MRFRYALPRVRLPPNSFDALVDNAYACMAEWSKAADS